MVDPVTVSLALAVAGNLATNVVQSLGDKIEDTRAGRALAKVGLLKPGFDARLKTAVATAVERFLLNNTLYNLPEIHAFLESKSFARDIREMLLEQRGLSASKVMARLETYVGVPLSEAPESWPNRIDPRVFVENLFSSFTTALGEQADEGMIWLGIAIAEQGITLRGISKKLDILISAQPQQIAADTQYDGFRDAYIAHLINRAQRISTPGARELRGINQSLSVAYISLNLKADAGSEAVRAEAFLSQHSHVAIRGPAGSGKTTLLNWLITKCTTETKEADDKWGGYVPFFIPLRKVARLHQGPPSLDKLIEYSVDNKLWTLPTPPGWLNKTIAKKRAILMIDGVDELPPSRRVEFWEWLADFVDTFPENRVIVTSRALPGSPADSSHHEQWNPPKTFIDAQLQDMSDSDVTSFIHHWHDAIDFTKLDEQELVSLAEARASLPAKLEDTANRRIRELCNTPLLCAMICVLHWKEEGYLPRQRVEVYERCCDMLIEARDHKRGVLPPPGPIAAMSKSDKEMVLQQLAIEMMHNRDDTDVSADDMYRIEISRDKALAWIEPRITRFQSNIARDATAPEVLDYLVERTGLLREPAKDLIDFPHRTFQEYLAACAAGADNQESMLAKQADDDQWHETIMLAAGTNTGGVGFGRKLIENLIKRGERHQSAKERSQRIRKTCFALALGCLENLRQQDEELRESVLSNLGELVPPRNDGDARILSVAGDAAVSYLPYHQWKDENTATLAACARALRLIGTTEALKALSRGYSSDPRQAVVSEVCKSGAFAFSTIPLVAETVLASGKLPRFADTADLELLDGLSGLKKIEFDAAEVKNVDIIGSISSLVDISIEGVTERSSFIHNLPDRVETLRLVGNALPHGDWITRLSALDSISFIGISAADVSQVIQLISTISNLSIVASEFSDASFVNRVQGLKEIYLAGLPKLASVAELGDNDSLIRISIEECNSLREFPCGAGFDSMLGIHLEQPRIDFEISGRLSSRSNLESLTVNHIGGISSLDSFGDVKKLANLEVFHCSGLRNLDALANLDSLRQIELSHLDLLSLVKFPGDNVERLSVSNITALTNQSFEAGLPRLESINVERCVKLESLEFIVESADLATVRLSMMPRLSSLSALRGKERLTSLSLFDCDGVDSLSDLDGLDIEELALVSMDNIRDIEVISAMHSLRSLTLIACDGIGDLSFALGLPNLETIWLSPHDEGIHVPEALMPKVSRTSSGRSVYIRQRKPWWREENWMLHELNRAYPYRRYARSRPYRWID